MVRREAASALRSRPGKAKWPVMPREWKGGFVETGAART